MLDEERACVHQAAYVITARKSEVPARKALLRLAAMFNCTDFQGQLPAVRWNERSYRPRVADYRALTLALSMFTNNREWRNVDTAISEVMASGSWEKDAENAPDIHDVVARCLRLRAELVRGNDLSDLVHAAMRSL